MIVTISRERDQRWVSERSMLFHAHDEAGNVVTVEASVEAWETIQAHHNDPIAKVEELALGGHWEPFGSDKVWRVYLR